MMIVGWNFHTPYQPAVAGDARFHDRASGPPPIRLNPDVNYRTDIIQPQGAPNQTKELIPRKKMRHPPLIDGHPKLIASSGLANRP